MLINDYDKHGLTPSSFYCLKYAPEDDREFETCSLFLNQYISQQCTCVEGIEQPIYIRLFELCFLYRQNFRVPP